MVLETKMVLATILVLALSNDYWVNSFLYLTISPKQFGQKCSVFYLKLVYNSKAIYRHVDSF